MEYAESNIRVVATAPGGTDAAPRCTPRNSATPTDQEKAWYQGIVEQTIESSLMKRYGTLDEQAGVILFLASDEASYITGTVIPVAGAILADGNSASAVNTGRLVWRAPDGRPMRGPIQCVIWRNIELRLAGDFADGLRSPLKSAARA